MIATITVENARQLGYIAKATPSPSEGRPVLECIQLVWNTEQPDNITRLTAKATDSYILATVTVDPEECYPEDAPLNGELLVHAKTFAAALTAASKQARKEFGGVVIAIPDKVERGDAISVATAMGNAYTEVRIEDDYTFPKVEGLFKGEPTREYEGPLPAFNGAVLNRLISTVASTDAERKARVLTFLSWTEKKGPLQPMVLRSSWEHCSYEGLIMPVRIND